jgi:hypothetical protein
MVNTLFINGLTFVFVNKALSPHIFLHRSICYGCPFPSYLYVFTVDALGYLLEGTCIKGQIHGIFLSDGLEMVKTTLLMILFFW